LAGIDNGSASNHSPFKGNQVETCYGRALVILKSTKQAGAIRLNLSADGVKPATATIATLSPEDARLAEAATNRDKARRENNKKFSRHHLAKIAKLPQVENLVSGKTATASSSSPQHPPIHAIDGDPQTRWCPTDGKTGHCWQVDLGSARDLKGAKIIWQTAGKYQYTVEGSSDGAKWLTISDQSKKEDAQQVHNLAFDHKAIRYVRITAIGLPNGLWGTFTEVEIYGLALDDSDLQSDTSVAASGTGLLTVAPVFKHGLGQHADSVVASRSKKPPTWSENDARRVVVDEAKRQGVTFILDGKLPRVEGIRSSRDGKASSEDATSAPPGPLVFDGVDPTGKIVFEILTSEDVPDRTDNTDRITDFLAAAQKLTEELKTKSGDYVAGVFYDPLAAKGTVADEEPLRAQVRDFIAWLKKEKNLK